MATNIMNEYIKLTEKHITGYMKLILKDKFDNDIFKNFLKSYLNARYYDLNGFKNDNTLKSEILSELEAKKDKLLEKVQIQKEPIENTYIFFTHMLYFDKVIPNKDLEKTIYDIDDLRVQLLGKDDKNFKTELRLMLSENIKEIDDLLEKYESSEFYISITNYKDIKNVYKMNLKYNFAMPRIYSNYAIDKAFTTGTVNEDKLFIEYSLAVIQIIQDVIRGNFKKQYTIEFAESLLKKQKKMQRVLNVVENQVIQDKLNFKITYKIFLEYKEEVISLIKKGFRFAVIIDDSFENSIANIEKLNIFSYIMINENAKWYHHIVDTIDNNKIIEVGLNY